ncbi:MAG: hypothetical protein ACI9KE_004637 [Polyangiales bacterium]|jgi:hypothetical protein
MRPLFCVICVFSVACGSSAETELQTSTGDETTTEPGDETIEPETELPPGFPPAGAERPEMSAGQCAEANAEVIGDIGDGSTHRTDYVCPSGAAPIGTVFVGTEGSVCCPQ